MILSDDTIHHMVFLGQLGIKPYDVRRLQGATYDLTLGEMDLAGVHLVYDHVSGTDLQLIPRGSFWLASTREYLRIPIDILGIVAGKSSLGREGLGVEIAGVVDPMFEGEITLELYAYKDIPLPEIGMPICQIYFMQLDQPANRAYNGKYLEQRGPTVSRRSQ